VLIGGAAKPVVPGAPQRGIVQWCGGEKSVTETQAKTNTAKLVNFLACR